MQQLKQLPKYFVIKWTDSPLWVKYIEWLNEKRTGFPLTGNEKDMLYGFPDKNGVYAIEHHRLTNEAKIITLEQWNDIVNGDKEVTEPKQDSQTKMKLRVDILGPGKLLKELIEFVANHNAGKTDLNLSVFEAYIKAARVNYPKQMADLWCIYDTQDKNKMHFTDNGGDSWFLTIWETIHFELTGCPTLDLQEIGMGEMVIE